MTISISRKTVQTVAAPMVTCKNTFRGSFMKRWTGLIVGISPCQLHFLEMLTCLASLCCCALLVVSNADGAVPQLIRDFVHAGNQALLVEHGVAGITAHKCAGTFTHPADSVVLSDELAEFGMKEVLLPTDTHNLLALLSINHMCQVIVKQSPCYATPFRSCKSGGRNAPLLW